MHRGFSNYAKNMAVVVGLCVTSPFVGLSQAKADMMPTDQVLSTADDARQNLKSLVERDDVRNQLSAMGVAPDEAQQRIASLSDSEVQRLNGQLESLPAGGASDITLSIGAAVIIVLLLVIFF